LPVLQVGLVPVSEGAPSGVVDVTEAVFEDTVQLLASSAVTVYEPVLRPVNEVLLW
jgi:hypothetical protein